MKGSRLQWMVVLVAGAALSAAGCRNHMPHAFTWPAGGDVQYTHAKPPEGGYYKNWDKFAYSIEITPVEDVNPVRTQHFLIATVRDKDGKPLPNRRVEWMISEGGIGDIVEVDESGWRASRGYKVDNKYAVSHTNNYDHVLDMGDSDPSNDIKLTKGQTWCVITSPVEGDTYITAYAPGIYDRSKHKVFAIKHWYDIQWEFPPEATNPIGTTHEFVTTVTKYSDGSPLPGHIVTYTILDGPPASFEAGSGTVAQVPTDANGQARVRLRQSAPAEGTNRIQVDIYRPENIQCCKPGAHIATGYTAKTWIGPKIACNKTGPSQVKVGEQFSYDITVTNPSAVDATNVVVTDSLPSNVTLVSSNPPGSGQWSLGTIPPGGSMSVNLTVVANNSGTFENCAEVRADYNLSARCCATVTAVSPQLAIEKRCPSEIILCDPIEYVIVVRNPGDGPATNVQITDTLPDGVMTSDGKSSAVASVGTLAPGESREFRFTAKATRTGTFDNRVTATADGGLTASANCVTTVKQPMLAVEKTSPGMRFLGRPGEFTITVRNTGDAPARDTVLEDPIPAGWEFISASDGGQFSGGRVTWSLGTIEAGGSRNVSITLKAASAGSGMNVATARAYCTEAQASVPVEVQGVAAILLEVVDVSDPIEVGADETYIITVTNQGTANDTNIVIECTLPPEMDFVSAQGPSGVTHTVTGKTVRFSSFPSLAPKARIEYRVVTKGTGTGDLRFRTVLTSDVLQSPVEETESTHVY